MLDVTADTPGSTTVATRPALHPPAGALQGAELTAERLLQAAHDLLYDRAGGAVSLSELSARAGANIAMVKYCFGGKDALFDALLERVVTTLVAELDDLDRDDLSPTDKLRLHIRAVVRNYVRYPYLNRLLNERFLSGREEVATRLSDLFARPTRDWYARLLHEGEAAGEFRHVDPTFFFFSVLGACELIFSARSWLERAFANEIDEQLLEEFTEHTTRLVLAGVTAP